MQKVLKTIFAIIILAAAAYGSSILYYQVKGKEDRASRNLVISSPDDQISDIKLENVPVVVVPHFDFAKDERHDLLNDLTDKIKPKAIILVSVNHFNSGNSEIISTKKSWRVAGGEIDPEENLEENLVASGLASNDEIAFTNEHGITNILSDIKEAFIGVPIVPIVIKDGTDRAKIDQLADWVKAECSDCLMVSSVDFSHYQPSALAKVHDQFSIQALSNLNYENIWLAETDSPQTLYLSAKVAESRGAKNFHLIYNANSGEANGEDDAETTSVVLGYYSDQTPKTAVIPSTSFVIAGDAMFDRNVWHNYKIKGLKAIFDNFGTRVFRGSDLALINLEGPISNKEIDDDWQSGSMVFNFPPATASTLKYLNINTVSLANNHTANAGTTGLSNTKEVLDRSGIKCFGEPYGYDESSVLRVDGGIPVSVIGIMALSDFNESVLEARIAAEKSDGRFVIVFPHWGTEYAPKHSVSQESMAKKWIAAGAGLVVGSHPHVTQDFEIINGKPVVYSLGNFIFDQFFSTETQEGLVLAGFVTQDKITLSFLPTKEKLVKPEFTAKSAKTDKIESIFDINFEDGFKKLSSDTIEIKR
jgi:poly-gamma-glutamate synthesis protein (capsule biosynthesis protein)